MLVARHRINCMWYVSDGTFTDNATLATLMTVKEAKAINREDYQLFDAKRTLKEELLRFENLAEQARRRITQLKTLDTTVKRGNGYFYNVNHGTDNPMVVVVVENDQPMTVDDKAKLDKEHAGDPAYRWRFPPELIE